MVQQLPFIISCLSTLPRRVYPCPVVAGMLCALSKGSSTRSFARVNILPIRSSYRNGTSFSPYEQNLLKREICTHPRALAAQGGCRVEWPGAQAGESCRDFSVASTRTGG